MAIKKVKKSSNFFPRVTIFVVVVLGVIQIFMANSLSVQGKEIDRLESLRLDLQREIDQLKEESSNLSSLESVRQLAKQKLSMVEGFESFDYLGSSVALR